MFDHLCNRPCDLGLWNTEDEWKYIREAIQRNWVFGNNKFKEDIENLLGRKFEIKRAGKMPKI